MFVGEVGSMWQTMKQERRKKVGLAKGTHRFCRGPSDLICFGNGGRAGGAGGKGRWGHSEERGAGFMGSGHSRIRKSIFRF